MPSQLPVGIFDSGLGGVSVLRDMAAMAPNETFIYYGDDKNAPYGTRPQEEILRLASAVTDTLLARNIKALVIACNTATSAAAAHLRAVLSIPVVGMEPALKPAALSAHGGRVLVLATPATLRQEKFQILYRQYGDNALVCPCPGLMEFVERLELDSPALDDYLEKILLPYRGETIDSAVLGCTHYVFLKTAIARHLPGVPLIDGNAGTARQLMRLLERGDLLSPGPGSVEFLTSGDPEIYLPRMRALFELPPSA